MKKFLLIGLTFFTINLHSQNRIESALEESFFGGIWETNAGTNYQYDASNNLTSETRYFYDESEWTASFKSIFTYNAANKAVTRTEQFWNNTAFENAYKSTYTYNTSGQLITILYEEWLGSAWANEYKDELTYNGNLISIVISSNWTGGQWVNDYRGTATYTGTVLTQILSESWEQTQWIIEERTVLTYNVANKITNQRYDEWTGTAWEEVFNTNYLLATNGNRLSEIFSFGGLIQNKEDYTYDAAAQLCNFGHPFKDKTGLDYLVEDFPYVNKVLNALNYNYNVATSSYNLSSRITYNYQSQLLLDKTNFEIKNISLYPNPVKASFELSGLTQSEQVSIYNVLGNKVFEGTVNANEKIDVQGLTNGLYFLNFKNGTAIKFLKE